MHKSQVFFYLLVAFILGVFINSFEVFEASGILLLTIVGLVVLALSYKNKYGLLVGFLILAFVLGGWRFYSVNSSIALTTSQILIGQEEEFIGYIAREPEVNENIQRFAFMSGDSRILVTTSSYPRYKFGDKLAIIGELEPPQNFSDDFDYVTYLKKDGIGMTLFFPEISRFLPNLENSDDKSRILDFVSPIKSETKSGENYNGQLKLSFWESNKVSLYKNIFALKSKFESTINKSISEPSAAFINGILLGTRQNFSDEMKEAFSKTGTTHILAISGYNIMIISEAVLLGLIWFFRRRTAFWISVAVIILFVILTGASASVVRAAVMGLILSFARGHGRLYDQKNSIVLAGGAMIWINPFVLNFDIGFQLSFAAVFGLIYLYPYIDSKLYKIPKVGVLKETFLMTLSAQLAVLPLILYYFGYFSPISLLANVLILPFIPFAMLAGFIAGLAGMIYLPLGQGIGYIAWAITTYQIEVIRYLSSLNFLV